MLVSGVILIGTLPYMYTLALTVLHLILTSVSVFFTCANMTVTCCAGIRFFEATHSGSCHNDYPGDSRIVLDLAGLVSM